MPKKLTTIFLLFCFLTSFAQTKSDKLTIEKIMRDPKWIGTSPSNVEWSDDGQYIYFNWNPDHAPADSMYSISLKDHTPVKLSVQQKQNLTTSDNIIWSLARTAFVYEKDGDIFFKDIKTGKTKHIIQTIENETNPQFSFNDTKIVYTSNQNLYAWDIATGEMIQLTNLQSMPANHPQQGSQQSRGSHGSMNSEITADSAQAEWLENDQLQYLQVLKKRKEKKEATETYNKNLSKKELKEINISNRVLQNLTISPDGRFISYRLMKRSTDAKSTIVANYVTETGYTEDIPGRTKVGAPQSSSEFFIYDREKDTVLEIKTDSIPGIRDLPDYVKDYPQKFAQKIKDPPVRPVIIWKISWSPKGTYAILEIHSRDHKDRWLMLFDTAAGKLKTIDRQRDEAWIGGPGTGIFDGLNTGWINENTFWFQSEVTGYSHLYIINVETGERKALTSGKFEVLKTELSKDKKYFYITTNEVHPGEQQFYRLPVTGGKAERITTMIGANLVTISPDEKYIAILYSYSNKPWELYLQENLPAGQVGNPGGKIEQITTKAMSEEFKSYPWRDPELITFTARDGAEVHARIYKPATPASGKPAVLFVHGAGYLQNAHKWWSYYFREFMFNNLLADNGYYVMDVDYRGSAGYGRDWRTAIYRHMGGKDLDDNADAANYLVKTFGVDPEHIGLYGGSYGGFITLMALFTTPDVFAAGAALRPVTDWANYNHGYTSEILNEPYNDSLAYRRSSPIYFAEGLKSHLLICHGMVDENVHFQDAVKLTQRLIELGKDNWEIAPYPMEDHGFTEPSSWTDEYKRIFKLFESTLKK
ncbi:MAG: alpha/beta fold hydrolase [Chitinophagales bacterium]